MPNQPGYKLTQEDVDGVIANYNQWFDRGSNLFYAAEHIMNKLRESEEPDEQIVGRPISNSVKGKWRWEFDTGLMAAMLFAMATEAWIKGLIVMELDNEHNPDISKAQTAIAAAFRPTKISSDQGLLSIEIEDPDAYREAVQNRDNAYAGLSKEAGEKLKPLRGGNHDLVEMARAAGIKVRKRTQLSKTLNELSVTIQLGRYPALLLAERHMILSEGILDGTAWILVRDAIKARYEKLLEDSGLSSELAACIEHD